MKRSGLRRPGRNKYSPIGLDMGATSIKMAQLKRVATGWAISEMLVKEINLSTDENGERRGDALVNTIKACMKESSFSGKSVVSVMPGYQLDILPVKFSLSGDESMEDAILEKARAHLSYDVEKAVIDYIPVEDGETGRKKDHPIRSLLVAAQREDVDNHLSILKRAKLKPVALDISACALARVIRYSGTEKNNNVLVINMGNRHTSLTLAWKNNLLLDRTIQWGRENLMESLMNRLKLDQQKAEGLLSRNGLHSGQNEEPAQEDEHMSRDSKTSEVVYGILAQQVETLSKEIDMVLQYLSSEMRGAVIDVLYVMGSSSTVRDLDIYLGKRTGISTERFNLFGRLKMGAQGTPKDVNGYGAYLGVPVGLAMRGITDKDMGI
jgi:type IV pilus assembly protein PilM